MIDDQLSAVGGKNGSQMSNKLFTFHQKRYIWIEKYPSMSLERSQPGVITSSESLHTNVVVIGGLRKGGNSVAVELFNSSGNSWCRLTSLPYPLPLPCATVCRDQLYVIGCDTDGYICSLSNLLSSCKPSPKPLHCSPLWSPLPSLPVENSTAVVVGGQLVIFGGRKRHGSVQTIHQLLDRKWMEIGSMCNARWDCAAVAVSPDSVIVVGGENAWNSVEECIVV